MAAFPTMTVTNAGLALQAKVQAGAALTFTRIALGDGQLNGQPIAVLADMISQKASVPVDSVRVVGANTCQVGGFFSNATLEQGFWWREIGIFATDPDQGEILYGYTNAGDAGDYIPTVQDTRIERNMYVSIGVAGASDVTITIPSSDSYVLVAEKGQPDGVAELDSTGKVPAEQLPSMDYVPNSQKGVGGGVATLDGSGKLVQGQIPDIDCGVWDTDPVASHNATADTHRAMLVDGNNVEPVDSSQSLEEHIANPQAHQNLKIDGNNT